MMQARTHDVSVEHVESMLLSRLDSLVRSLPDLQDGHKLGHEYLVRLPGRDKHGSMSININTGKWADFSGGRNGSRTFPCLSLIAVFVTDGRWKSDGETRPGCIRWARDWLGLTDRRASPAKMRALDEEAERARAKRDKELKNAQEKNRAAAHAMWLAAIPLDGHDPASLYLAARAIDIHALKELPGALRWTSRCRRYHAQNDYSEHVAMLSAMHLEGAPDGFAAVHRTYLEEQNGRWWKAFGKQSKTILGPKSGATIRLTKGSSGLPLKRAPQGEDVWIAEGIENALSAALVMPDARVLAAGTLENIGKVQLPKQITTIAVCADNDKADTPADRALRRLVDETLPGRGFDVEERRAPHGFKDFNAVLMGERQ